MKTITVLASLLGFATLLATAAPVENAQRDVVRRSPQPKAASAPYPRDAILPPAAYGSGYPTANISYPVPTGTAVSYPYPTATSISGPACSPNGQLICNGESEFALCNWGTVLFQPVADGTACVNGSITWAADYPH